MAKPIFIIKTDRDVLLSPSKMEEFRELFSQIVKTIGDEYHVIALEKKYDVEVFGIENVELTDEEFQELMDKIRKETEEN